MQEPAVSKALFVSVLLYPPVVLCTVLANPFSPTGKVNTMHLLEVTLVALQREGIRLTEETKYLFEDYS